MAPVLCREQLGPCDSEYVTERPGAATLDGAYPGAADAPFIHVIVDPAPRVEGLTSFFAGHRLSGYAAWDWDGQQLRAETDRFGLHPLFYFHDGRQIALSTSLPAIVARLPRRDWDFDALGIFFRAGFFLDDETPLRQIRAAPRSLIWRQGHLHAPAMGPEPRAASYLPRPAVEAEFGRLFAASIRKRLDGRRVWVPLTGGRDSRHIFLELLRSGARVEAAVTVDARLSTEREVGAELCRRAGVRHVSEPATLFTLPSALERNREASFCSAEHFFSLSLRKALRRENAECIFDGMAGDILTQSKNLTAQRVAWMRRGELRTMAESLLASEERMLGIILAPDVHAAMPLARAIERLAEELARHQHQPNPVGSFYFWNRMRRNIALAPFSVLREFHPHVPYLDDQLHELLASIPAEFLLEEKLHDAVIRREFPAYADVAYARSRPAPHRPQALRVLESARYALAKGNWVRKAPLLVRLLYGLVSPAYRDCVNGILHWPIYLRQLSEL